MIVHLMALIALMDELSVRTDAVLIALNNSDHCDVVRTSEEAMYTN